MPLGNGDIGINVWFESNGDILFYVSKVDAYDSQHLLPKLGRIRLRTEPALDVNNVKTTLLLEQAAVEILAGDTKFRVWVDANAPVIRVQGHCPTPRKVSIAAESLRQWQNAADPLPGSGTAALLFHDNSDMSPGATATSRPSGRRISPTRTPRRSWRKPRIPSSTAPPAACSRPRVSSVSTRRPSRPRRPVTGIDATVRVLTNQAGDSGCLESGGVRPVKSDWNAHLAWWKAFWNRSHIFIPKAGEGTYNLDQYRFTQFPQARDVYEGHKEIPGQRRTPIRSRNVTRWSVSARPSPAAARSRHPTMARSSPWTCPPA